ncbi:MAG: HAD-IA family hydrolase [Actinomycetota bacterium]|nr:HAD-IA family hydrolase [Actinomycetota bacterium]
MGTARGVERIKELTVEIVFFDAGETLVHPHPSFHELFSAVCSEAGYGISADDVATIQGRLAPHLVDLAEETGVDNPSLSPEDSVTFWSYLYRRFLQELGIEDERLVKSLYAVFSTASSYKLYEDALPALTELRASGYRIGLISNFEEWLEEMLVELEVGHLFDTKVISGVEGVEKPDPEIYRLALQRAGVSPGAALHVGDSPGLDVRPAQSVGMIPVLLDRWDRYSAEEVPRIRSLEELTTVVAKF